MQFRFTKINLITLICSITCLLVWTGISGLHATEDDSDNNTTASFQNQAQAQHANNVATIEAFNDPDVIAAIDKAEETGDPDDIARAHDLFAETVGVLTSDISDMRGDGMGWGDIAHHFGLHPSVIGLGHSSSFGKFGTHISKQDHTRSELKAATARSFKGGNQSSHGIGVNSGVGVQSDLVPVVLLLTVARPGDDVGDVDPGQRLPERLPVALEDVPAGQHGEEPDYRDDNHDLEQGEASVPHAGWTTRGIPSFP